ncbi:MAG: T9SS type A sorting domain-containing protein [Owenweeksia sp.]
MKRFLLVLLGLPFILLAQNEELKMLNYNLMYYRASSAPCSQSITPTQRDQNLKTIIKYVDPDIFTVNEMGANASNYGFVRDFILNSDGVTKYASAQYSNNSFSSLTNMLYYNSNKLGLLGQTAITTDKSGNNLVRIIDLYNLYYKDPKLSQGADTVTFIVAVAHLKAGNSTSDALERLDATEALMDWLEKGVSENNVILCGDFNVYTNSEPAYQKLINYSVASERFNDPLNQGGSWSNNSAYAGIHTQSTHSSSSGCFSGGGLDDRFDFFLVSDEIMNGTEGVSYALNSYTAIGQDGNHFNQSVNSGTNSNVPANIADALYNFSDHLPIFMKISVALSNLNAREPVSLKENLTYNNPVHDELILRLSRSSSTNLTVRLLDLTGKTVFQDNWIKGSFEKLINTDRLPNGVYLINVSVPNGETITKKIIKN